MKTKKLLTVFALLTVIAMVLGACGPAAAPAPQPTQPPTPPEKKTFIFGSQGEPVCLDPALITDGISGRVTNQIFEGLVKFDGATTNVVPSLAEKWDTSEDGKVWTFYLRKGVKFHDGTPFNADAVVKNWDYWANTSNPLHKAQTDAGQTFEYYEGQFYGFDDASVIEKVEAKDENTAVITLRNTQGPFLNNLAMFVFVFWSPTALEAAGVESCKKPVGTGPFKFVEWAPDQYVTLAKNAEYWDAANAAKVDEVIIKNIKDNSARLNALKAGEIHGLEGMEPDSVKTVKEDSSLQLILRPANTTGYLAFNFKIKEFQDLKVRQAFAHALDKQTYADAFFGGGGIPAKEFQPPALWGYNPDIVDYEYDIAKAKELLTAAGFPDGLTEITKADGTKGTLELWYMPVSRPYVPNGKDLAEAIAADLGKAGIKVELKTVDWAVYLDKRKIGELPLYMLGWTGDNGDPDNFTCYFLCKTGEDNPREGFFPDEEIAQILNEAAVKITQEERIPLYQKAEQLLHDRALRLFIAHNQPPLAFSAKVTGYVPNPTGTEYFNTVDIAQ